MNKANKSGVPALRFPEFKNAPVWEEKKLEDVADRYDNLRVPVTTIDRVSGCTPYYGANGIQDYVKGYTHDGEFILIAEDGANDLKNYPVQYVNGKIWVNNHAHVLQSKKDIANNHFLKFIISQANIEPFLVGGGRAKLNAGTMMKIKMPFPKLKEQQKIANCLTALDDLITAQSQKVDSLKQHKKGLMQQLFPQADTNRPKLRFPDFKNSPKWEEKKLGDIADFYNGKAHEKNIVEHGKYIVVNSKFISTNGTVKKYTNNPKLLANTGDIVMVMSDIPNGKAIAKCFRINQENYYTINQRICLLKPIKNNSNFLFFILNRNKYYLNFDDGVKQTNLRNNDVLNCPLNIPKPPEQQKIANCLTSLDDLITAQSQKIATLQQHKKGLMQKLFPEN